MRKITYEAAKSLLACRAFSSGNTTVAVNELDNERYSEMRLHGNRIARYFPSTHRLVVWDCGWQTPTAIDRLNGILRVADLNVSLWQENYEWYYTLDGENYIWGGFETFSTRKPEPAAELVAA
jgi:hypothetical protein